MEQRGLTVRLDEFQSPLRTPSAQTTPPGHPSRTSSRWAKACEAACCTV